ncbi:MAG: hypothetical protein FJ144_14725 [Deltaproteobacteria bacterium]|nr:hypothetical protein [Deltaproteobacteria bacterium]
MTHSRFPSALALVAALALGLGFALPAGAGAPGSEDRLIELDAVCRGGSQNGTMCTSHPDCPNGRCKVRSAELGIRPHRFHVTLIVDDDTSEFDGSQDVDDVVTVTAILEFVAKGRRQIVAQTYENLKGADAATIVANLQQGVEIADLPSRDRRLDETLLNASVAEAGILDDFLFQAPDGEMQAELRERFGTDGHFVAIKARKLNVHADHGADGLASVVEIVVDVIVTSAE